MARRSGRRSGPAGHRDKVTAAAAALKAHKKECWACHAADGHPGLYCGQGFQLAQDVTRARVAASLAARARDDAQGRLL